MWPILIPYSKLKEHFVKVLLLTSTPLIGESKTRFSFKLYIYSFFYPLWEIEKLFIIYSFKFSENRMKRLAWKIKENKIFVSSMIHSARPTILSVVITVLAWIMICFVKFWKVTDVQTPHAKIVISTGRDYGSAKWINRWWKWKFRDLNCHRNTAAISHSIFQSEFLNFRFR